MKFGPSAGQQNPTVNDSLAAYTISRS